MPQRTYPTGSPLRAPQTAPRPTRAPSDGIPSARKRSSSLPSPATTTSASPTRTSSRNVRQLRAGPARVHRRPDLREGGRLRDRALSRSSRGHPGLPPQVVPLRVGVPASFSGTSLRSALARRPRRLPGQHLGRRRTRECTRPTGKPKGRTRAASPCLRRFVNTAVERTQTSHMPDPPDPHRRSQQGIGVYYSSTFVYGGLSVRHPRGPQVEVRTGRGRSPRGRIVNGWAQNPGLRSRHARATWMARSCWEPRQEAVPRGVVGGLVGRCLDEDRRDRTDVVSPTLRRCPRRQTGRRAMTPDPAAS